MRRIRSSLRRERMLIRKSLQIDRIKRDKNMNNSFNGRLGGSKRTSIPTTEKEMKEKMNGLGTGKVHKTSYRSEVTYFFEHFIDNIIGRKFRRIIRGK